MQMCPDCGNVYDESDYASCPYCDDDVDEGSSHSIYEALREFATGLVGSESEDSEEL